MRTYDLTPFYRSTVGFDRFFNLLDQATSDGSPGYPPTISSAPARTPTASALRSPASRKAELSIVAKENTLTIKGEKSANENRQGQFRSALPRHRRARLRARLPACRFRAGEERLARERPAPRRSRPRDPEAKKPRSIPINSGAKAPQVVDASAKVAALSAPRVQQILAERENAPGKPGAFFLSIAGSSGYSNPLHLRHLLGRQDRGRGAAGGGALPTVGTSAAEQGRGAARLGLGFGASAAACWLRVRPPASARLPARRPGRNWRSSLRRAWQTWPPAAPLRAPARGGSRHAGSGPAAAAPGPGSAAASRQPGRRSRSARRRNCRPSDRPA